MYGSGHRPNGQWDSQGFSSPPVPRESGWSSNAPSTPMPVPTQNWPVALGSGQTWPNTSVMPPRAMNPRPRYQSPTHNAPNESGNSTFDGHSNSFNSWAKPMPLLGRKRPFPVEEADVPDNNYTRPRSGPWPKSGDWSESDANPGSTDWTGGSDNNSTNSWSNPRGPRPNADGPRPTWSQPDADRPTESRPPWSKPNDDTRPRPPWSKTNADTWSKPNSDDLPKKPWQKSNFQKPGQSGFARTAFPKPKAKTTMDPRSVLGSIVTTYYVNQEKVNMPKELTSQFEPLKCGLCGVLVNSTVTAKTHYSGKVHDKKVVQFMQKWCAEKGQPLPEQFKEGVSRKQTTNLLEQEARILFCSVCNIPLTSKQHADQHYMGKSHKKASESGGLKKSISPLTAKSDPSGRFNIGADFVSRSDPLGLMNPETKVIEKTVQLNTNPFVCLICCVSTTSKEQLDVHLGGARHRKKVAAAANTATSADNQKIPPPAAPADTILATLVQRPKTVVRAQTQNPPDEKKPDFSIFRTPSGQYYCAFCNVTMNSESQFGQHTDSKRHKLSVANSKGKNQVTGNGSAPPKPIVKTVQQ